MATSTLLRRVRTFIRLIPASRVNGSAAALSGAGRDLSSMPASHGLAPRLSSSSKQAAKAKLIPKAEPKASILKPKPEAELKKKTMPKLEAERMKKSMPKAKPTEQAESLVVADDDEFGIWPTRSVHLRRLGLSSMLVLIFLHFKTAKDGFFDEICDQEYKIKVQAAKKELLKTKLTRRTQ